ncbi:FxLYD domain-containing protein [Micromonospora sp. NPDC047707]|uniref:FxLYD domain-containing protein n=1 Tax=Micromonospora sp. NPDC047707 TaxID=3154498 RepID=UPI0034536C6A
MSNETPAPPQGAPTPQPGFAPAPPPKKGMSTGLKVFLIIAGLSVLLCGGGFVACTALVGKAASDVSKNQEAKVGHVKLTSCEAEAAGNALLANVKFDVEVNNSSDEQNTYFIDVFVLDSKGTRVGNTTTIVSDVRPGQKAVEEGMVVLSQQVSGKITCKVDKVS